MHMIKINNVEKEYVIDLNEVPQNEHKLDVESYDDELYFLSWGVSFSNGTGFSYQITSRDSMLIEIDDYEEMKNEGLIILKNNKKESINIKIKPNESALNEKVYTFKLGTFSSENDEISINIVSKMNGKSKPWEIDYDGRPYNLDVSATKTKLKIKSNEQEGFEFLFNIVLLQEKSNNKLVLTLKRNLDGIIEIIKIDERPNK